MTAQILFMSVSRLRLFVSCTLAGWLLSAYPITFGYAQNQSISYTSSQLDSLDARLQSVLENKILRDARVGLIAKSLRTGQALFERNADSLLSTASCMKLVTTAAALDRWGKNKYFRTAFFTNDSVVNGTLKGNLYIKGYGDPYFVTEILLKTVYHFKSMGITEIKGDLIADDSYLQDSPNAYRNDRAYSALGSALSFNFNTFTICARPGKTGDTAHVFIEPMYPQFTIINRTLTTDSGTGVTIDHNTVSVKYDKNLMTVYVGGTIASDELEFNLYKRAQDPALYTSTVFRDALAQFGIAVKGKIRTGVVPKTATLIHETYSYDLAYIIGGINKWSNNQAAGQLLMILGAEEFGAPGTDEKGLRAIQPFLKKAGITSDEIVMVDGSGLDAQNKMTPRAQARLLEYMYNTFEYGSEYVSSLSIAGVDGSERKRFRKKGGPVGRARLKIGYLWSVSGLSGYIATSRGDVIAFCSLMNGFEKDDYETVKQLEDTICITLSKL